MDETDDQPIIHETRTPMIKLRDDNYHTWKRRMQMTLIKEDLWDTVIDPTPDNPDAKWIRRDRLAQASIGLAVSDKVLIHIKHEQTAKEIWQKLSTVHQHDSMGARLTLYRKIFSCRYHVGNSISDHINEILESVSKLEDRGCTLDPELICAALLGSLPKEFNTLITAIEARKSSDISVTYLREKIIEENNKHSNDRQHFSVKAMHTNQPKPRNPRTGPTCFYCKKVGHIRKDCRLLKQHTPHQGFIKSKNQSQHNNKTYPEKMAALTLDEEDEQKTILKWPNWNRDEITHKAMTTTINLPSLDKNHPKWIVDSGASAHMVNNLNLLTKTKQLNDTGSIITASGDLHSIHHTGECTIVLVNDKNVNIPLTLKGVIYSPELTDNLISVPQLTQEGYSLTFKGINCWLNHDKQSSVLATLENQLYVYRPITNQSDHTSRTHLCQHILHERMGHRQYKDIPDNSYNKENTSCLQEGLCETCHITKMNNKPFGYSTRERAKQPFDIFHLDLCGPIQPTSLGKNNYSLNIIDDHSKYSTVYLLNNKQQAASKIMEYVEQGINVFKRRPTILRSDGGGEFLGNELKQYLKKRGIKHHICLPYTPQNNGTIERANRTLMETTRALLHQTGLPKYMWGELLSTASYLNNRTLHKDIDKTPYELWTGKRPNLDHIRTIGTKCYFLNTKPDKKKLEDRGLPGVLIGYGEAMKVYRLWNPNSTKIHLSRCVHFEPEKCPLSKKTDDFNYITQPITIQKNSSEGENSMPSNSDQNNQRRSQRNNKGKPPNILSYDQQGHIETTRDYHQPKENSEIPFEDNDCYEH